MLTPILEKISLENKGYVMRTSTSTLWTMRQIILHLISLTIFVQTVSFHISISLHVIHHGLKLIDNILHNGINGNTISGNITDISDHLAQFLITSYLVHRATKPKKIITRTFKSFVQDNFKHDLQSVDWEYTLDIHPRHSKSRLLL